MMPRFLFPIYLQQVFFVNDYIVQLFYSTRFLFPAVKRSSDDRMPGRMNTIRIMVLAAPMEIVWHICSTVGSPKHCPRIPVTLTMISPEVRMVCMEPSYAFFSASALSNFLRFSR